MAVTKIKLSQTRVTADFDFGGYGITNLAAPSNANDAARKAYVDTEIAKVAGAMTYQSTWNATTNSPTIPAAAEGNKGHYYIVSTAGTTTVDGISDWEQRDWIVSNGTTWQKIDNTDKVTLVHGRTGEVTAESGDYNAGQITFTPTGSLAATDVQAALAEVDGDVTALDTRLDTAESDITAVEGRLDTVEGDVVGKLNKALASGKIFVGNGSGDAVAASYIVRETPIADGTYEDYTLASTPVSGTEQVFLNGVLQDVTDDYTITGAVITFVSAQSASDKVRVTYIALV